MSAGEQTDVNQKVLAGTLTAQTDLSDQTQTHRAGFHPTEFYGCRLRTAVISSKGTRIHSRGPKELFWMTELFFFFSMVTQVNIFA